MIDHYISSVNHFVIPYESDSLCDRLEVGFLFGENPQWSWLQSLGDSVHRRAGLPIQWVAGCTM